MWSSDLNTSVTSEGGFLDNSRKEVLDEVKQRRIQTLVPIMIGHLHVLPSVENIKFWDIPARMFVIIGIIRKVEDAATRISYTVQDQTGEIIAIKWLEADRKIPERIMPLNIYVRIHGLVREQNNKRHVFILRMWPLKKLNELTTHILEFTYATLKGKAMAKKHVEVGFKRCDAAATELPKEDSPYHGMTADQTIVYKLIQAQNDTESGAERSDIKANAPSRILPQVDSILDFLVSEGHIYTTSTDDQFKTT